MDHCLSLNPSFARGWHWSGLLRIFAGQPDLALEHFEIYLRLSPRDRVPGYLNGFGEALFFSRRFDEAAANLVASLERAPGFPGHLPRSRGLLCSHGTARRSTRDRQAARAITPVVVERAVRYRNPEHRELFLSGLRLTAGEAG